MYMTNFIENLYDISIDTRKKNIPIRTVSFSVAYRSKITKIFNTKLKETIERQISTNFDKMGFFYMAMETQNIFEIRAMPQFSHH